MQGRDYYGKGLIYYRPHYRPIFRLTKLAFLRARAIPREKQTNKQTKQEKQDTANDKVIYLLEQNIKSCNARRRWQRKQPKKISRSKDPATRDDF